MRRNDHLSRCACEGHSAKTAPSDSTSHPRGGAINLGVLRSNSNISATPGFPVAHGIDNWVVTVNRDCR
jgi:hypothetical protein